MKEAWIANIPKVAAYLTQKQSPYKDSSTPEGLYNITLILTGNEKLANNARTKLAQRIMETSLGGVPIEETVAMHTALENSNG